MHEPGGAALPAAQLLRILAGKLHDGPMQELVAARLDVLELAETGELGADVGPLVQRLGQRVEDAVQQLRALLQALAEPQHGLCAPAGLVEAVEQRVDAVAARNDVTIDLHIHGQGPEPAPAGRQAVLRVVREGLANITKHAAASQVLVDLHRGQQWCQVDIDDDGLGDPRACRLAMARQDDYGLRNLAEQARAAGGRFSVGAAPQLHGLRLSIAVPVATQFSR